MAAAITFNSDTLEGQLLECIQALSDKQRSTTDNPNNLNLINGYNRNMDTGVVTATIAIPTSTVIDTTDGSIDTEADASFN